VQADDYRAKIVQRGAVPPLINMLKTNDRALREMAAFALGRLAQNADNQAGIFAMGVLQPLLDLLTSKVKNLEHNAAFTLYGLADNPDNVPEIVKRVRLFSALCMLWATRLTCSSSCLS
jgi:HEAT repeat protein